VVVQVVQDRTASTCLFSRILNFLQSLKRSPCLWAAFEEYLIDIAVVLTCNQLRAHPHLVEGELLLWADRVSLRHLCICRLDD
jgi:hypothetical protein